MRRIVVAVLALFMCLCPFSGWAEETTVAPEDLAFFKEACESQSCRALIDAFGAFVFRFELKAPDERAFTVDETYWRDDEGAKQLCVEDGFAYLYADATHLLKRFYDGTNYFYLKSDPAVAERENLAFLDDRIFYLYEEEETLVSCRREGGVVHFETRYPASMSPIVAENWELTDENQLLTCSISFDEATKRLLRYDLRFLGEEDATTPALISAVLTILDGPVVLPSDVEPLLHPSETRRVTVIVEPGTAEEKTFTWEIDARSYGSVYTDTGYTMYNNPDATNADGSDVPSFPEVNADGTIPDATYYMFADKPDQN